MEAQTSYTDFMTRYKTKFAELYGYYFDEEITREIIIRNETKQAEGKVFRISTISKISQEKISM